MDAILVPARFCGPPTSANGGYFAGLVAAAAQRTLAVRLLRPPPLDTGMDLIELDDGHLEVRCGEELIATARPDSLSAPQVRAPDYLDAVEASRHYLGFHKHPAPSCFVCGPQRERGDGLRIFPGPLPAVPSAVGRMVAAPWVADGSLDAGDGKVAAEFMWAALDCPGWLALTQDARPVLLAELTAHVDRRLHVDERCIAIGWGISSEGRKHRAGTALFDEDGELCGYARALWIEPRPRPEPPPADRGGTP
jgi:hypothetical protein